MLLFIYFCKVSTLLVPVCESICNSLWCVIVCDCSSTYNYVSQHGTRKCLQSNQPVVLFHIHAHFLHTVKSFVAFVQYLFSQPGVECFLSGKLCQDPLEKFFGCQRQRGGVNENPTVHEFCSNTQALRVVNSFCQDVSRGNCRGQIRKIDLEKENIPLPKRRKHHK